jgi:hypothetical protein
MSTAITVEYDDKSLLNGQFPSAFRTATGKDTPTGRRGLAHQKTMGGFALLFLWAIGK